MRLFLAKGKKPFFLHLQPAVKAASIDKYKMQLGNKPWNLLGGGWIYLAHGEFPIIRLTYRIHAHQCSSSQTDVRDVERMPQNTPLLNEEQSSRSVLGSSVRHVVVAECADISNVLWLVCQFCHQKLHASVFLIPVERFHLLSKLEDSICRSCSDGSEKYTNLYLLLAKIIRLSPPSCSYTLFYLSLSSMPCRARPLPSRAHPCSHLRDNNLWRFVNIIPIIWEFGMFAKIAQLLFNQTLIFDLADNIGVLAPVFVAKIVKFLSLVPTLGSQSFIRHDHGSCCECACHLSSKVSPVRPLRDFQTRTYAVLILCEFLNLITTTYSVNLWNKSYWMTS